MTKEDEIHGVALSAQLVVFKLIGHLKAKGLISKHCCPAIS